MDWIDWMGVAVVVVAWVVFLAARERLLGRPVWPVGVR